MHRVAFMMAIHEAKSLLLMASHCTCGEFRRPAAKLCDVQCLSAYSPVVIAVEGIVHGSAGGGSILKFAECDHPGGSRC